MACVICGAKDTPYFIIYRTEGNIFDHLADLCWDCREKMDQDTDAQEAARKQTKKKSSIAPKLH